MQVDNVVYERVLLRIEIIDMMYHTRRTISRFHNL